MGSVFEGDSAWKAVKIGAGGYVTGVDIASDGTMVTRTDTYGAYIWNGTGWTQLVTAASMPGDQMFRGEGVYEIRIAPSNTNVMYMEMTDGIYKTVDKGQNWTKTSFVGTFNANSHNKTNGQKMAIDPTNPDVVFAGTENNGLWVTRDGGTNWQKISVVPQGSTNDPVLAGVVIKGSNVFVGTAGSGVYVSSDGGSSWKATGGPADVGYAAVGPDGSYFASDQTTGAVWKYANGAWTKFPISEAHAVAIDPFNAARIIVTNGGGSINVTSDGGATWSGWNRGSSQLESSNDVAWLETAELYMGSGGLAFDAKVPGKLWQAAGTGVWTSEIPNDFKFWTPTTWNAQSQGIEQLVANEVLAPAGGNPVFASWDRAFFESADLEAYPTKYSGGTFSGGWSVDYASSSPNFIVGISDWWGSEDSGFSTDGGKTWQKFAGLPSFAMSTVGGSIAASTPNNFVWVAAGNQAPAYTLDGGKTWANVTLPGVTDYGNMHGGYYLNRTTITADRVLPNTFYLFDSNSGVYRTADGGVSWSKVSNTPPGEWSYWNAKIEAVPGNAGELFFSSGSQNKGPTDVLNFMHSSDGGATWQPVVGVQAATFGYGAPAAAGGPSTVYVVGKVNGVYGIFYSSDASKTWTKIGEHPMGSLDPVRTISGDMDQFGKVYVGFGGSGFAYLDFANAQPTPTAPKVVTAPTQTVTIAEGVDDVGIATSVGNGAAINDSTPTLKGSVSGPLTAGQAIAVYRDGQKIGLAATGGSGWTFTDAGTPEGNHSYTARVEDAAGLKGAASGGFSLVIDTLAPTQQVSIASAVDNVGSATGSLANGSKTDDSSPDLQGTVSATLAADEKLVIYRDGVRIGQATVSGVAWTFADTNVANGSHSYTASVQDAAGNVGGSSSGFVLSVETLRTLAGTAANDVLVGSSSSERISGVADTGTRIGKGTIDVLTGNGGADVFVLGDSRGRFYDDGKGASAGMRDYARITDFGLDDKLQLKGSAAEYLQAWKTIDGFSGTAIFHDSNGNGALDSRDELIGLIQNQKSVDLGAMLYVGEEQLVALGQNQKSIDPSGMLYV